MCGARGPGLTGRPGRSCRNWRLDAHLLPTAGGARWPYTEAVAALPRTQPHPLGPQLPSGWASGVHGPGPKRGSVSTGRLLEAPGHSPCGWVVLWWPEAPPALPLAVAGWQQRLPLAVAETSARPACGQACGGGWGVEGGGWSGTWGGSGGGADPGAPGVVAMVSPCQSPHFSVLRASGGSSYFPERAGSRKGINAIPQRALGTLGSVDKMRCPHPRESSHPGGLSGVQEPRVGWGRVSCGCGPSGCGCGQVAVGVAPVAVCPRAY